MLSECWLVWSRPALEVEGTFIVTLRLEGRSRCETLLTLTPSVWLLMAVVDARPVPGRAGVENADHVAVAEPEAWAGWGGLCSSGFL